VLQKIATVREAKSHLSQLLRDVKRGREWIITERGKPIAKLTAARDEDLTLEQRLMRLEEAGIIGPKPPDHRPLPDPIAIEPGLAQRWLQEDRDG
jgi:prevent-host-death family protein